MQYDHFVHQVQHRARLCCNGTAVTAIRATLETLAERLAGGEAKDLASQLPREIGYYLLQGIPEISLPFGFREFIWRVAEREGVEVPKALFHARVVMEVLSEAISLGEMEDVIQQLPAEYTPLFSGSTGRMQRAPGQRGAMNQRRAGLPERGAEWEPRSKRQREYQGYGGDREEAMGGDYPERSWEMNEGGGNWEQNPGYGREWERANHGQGQDLERSRAGMNQGRAGQESWARSGQGRGTYREGNRSRSQREYQEP